LFCCIITFQSTKYNVIVKMLILAVHGQSQAYFNAAPQDFQHRSAGFAILRYIPRLRRLLVRAN
jgi:hypothetical protein